MRRKALTIFALLATQSVALAQQPPPPPVRYLQTQPTPVRYVPSRPYVQPAGDVYGFTTWLNGVRGRYGLGPVGHDPNLSAWAAQNNAHQQARGMGHYVMGPARRQNSATGNYASIGAMWLASPAHRAALLDPTIRWIGIAGAAGYWTFNGN